MLVDANNVMEHIAAAATSVAPVPSIVPSLPEYQTAGDMGNKILW